MVNALEPVLASVRRGPYLEAQHRGSVVVTGPDGLPRLKIGDVTSPVLPRSAVKPIQAVAMLRHGLDLDGADLALTGASHAGEGFHLAGVVSILDGCGLGVDVLQTPPAFPRDPDALARWYRAGRGPEPLAHNCSGKHAGMLRTCRRAGWPVDSYRDPSHPLQAAIRRTLGEFAGEPIGDPVVDGCGAPAFAMSLTGLARAFGTLASSGHGDGKLVADAFREHPEYASGTRRDEVVFHREVPGLVCKLGAEGSFAVGLPDGTGIAIKISDGAYRGYSHVLIALLDTLGLATDSLRVFDPEPVLGHGVPVGEVCVEAPVLDALRRV